jgi:hypothetical protein
MLSKSSRNLSRRISESLGLQICCNISMVKMYLSHITKDRERIYKLNTTSPSEEQTRVIGRKRSTLKSSVSSTKSYGTTLMNVT